MELKGAVVVVTGATGGLGQELCRAFAEHGARVAAVDVAGIEEAEPFFDELRSLGSPDVLGIRADVIQSESIASMVEQVVGRWGRLDVLVNAAAINRWVPFDDLETMDEQLWEQLLRADLTGPFLCSRAAAPIMKRQGCGRIVNIVSSAGFYPAGSSIAYAVAKAGLAHLTRCLAVALAPEVLVNAVSPGLMRETPMGQKMSAEQAQEYGRRAALRRTVSPRDVADQVVAFARSESTTGQNLLVDAGFVFR